MPYTKYHDPWVNADTAEGGGDESTPITAAALDYIEDGIATAQAAAEAAQGDITTDPAWAAKGDLIVGTGNDAAAIQSVSADDTVLAAASGQSTGVIWKKIGNAMIATNAAIDVSKLAPSSTANDVLTTVGGVAVWQAPAAGGITVYDRVTADVDVTSTTAETTMYSKSIAANALGSSGMLRLTLIGDWLYNSSGAAFTLAVKFGAVTVGSVALGTSTVISATRQPLRIQVELVNDGATNVQRVHTIIDNGFRNAHGTMNDGLGGWAIHDSNSIHNTSGLMYDDAAEDTTAAKTLSVTGKWGTSSASLSARVRFAILELL